MITTSTPLATHTQVTAGSDASTVITPDALAGSTIFGVKAASVVAFDYATNCATGDGKAYYPVPSSLNGMNLVGVTVHVITAGTTNTMDVMVHNLTQAADMLSTPVTVNSGATSASDGVIDTANDDVATGDMLRIDFDAVHTTPAQGAIITMTFQLP